MALATNLVSYYKLDDVNDSVGNNTLTNNNSVTFTTGKIVNAANFGSENTNKYLSIASQLGLAKNDARTISLWVSVTTSPTSSNVAVFNATQYNSSGVGYSVEYYNNSGTYNLRVGRWRNGTDDAKAYTATLTTGTWYHIAYTFSGTNEIVYLNGIQLGTNSPTISDGTAGIGDEFDIGKNSFGRYFSGLVDELGVWSRALSADEVSQLFNSGRGNAYPLTDTPSLYGGLDYYKLDESSGNASDSINANTLTNTGTATYGTGKINNGVDFGSSNTTKYLSIDSTLGMLGSDAKSYSFWVKINTAPSSGVQFMLFRHLYGGSAVGNYANVSYYNNSGTYEVRMPTSPGGSATTQTLTVGTWYHFVVTVPANNTGNITCYLNGSSFATTANWSQNYSLTTRLVLGADHVFADKSSCMIDEFSVFNRALTTTEISQLFLHGGAVQYPFANKGNFLNFTQ